MAEQVIYLSVVLRTEAAVFAVLVAQMQEQAVAQQKNKNFRLAEAWSSLARAVELADNFSKKSYQVKDVIQSFDTLIGATQFGLAFRDFLMQDPEAFQALQTLLKRLFLRQTSGKWPKATTEAKAPASVRAPNKPKT